MAILVTGHKGYIGSVLVPLFQKSGYEIRGLDTDYYKESTYGNLPQYCPEIKKDLRKVSVEDLKDVDTIVHLAGLSNDPLGDINSKLTYEINIDGTVHLAKMAKEAGVKRFLFSSSCSVYGASEDEIADEEACFNPVTPYGRSKVLAEAELKKLADNNFSPTFLRSGTAYGLSPRLRFDLVINNLTAWAYVTKKVYLKSDGLAWRPVVHIEDISRAFLSLMEAPVDVVHNQAFNVGIDEENYQIRDLATFVENLIPDSKVEYSNQASKDLRNYRVSFRKIHELIPGYKPVWTAEKGVKELYDAFNQNKFTLEEFEGPKYKRVAHIRKLIEEKKLNDQFYWAESHD